VVQNGCPAGCGVTGQGYLCGGAAQSLVSLGVIVNEDFKDRFCRAT